MIFFRKSDSFKNIPEVSEGFNALVLSLIPKNMSRSSGSFILAQGSITNQGSIHSSI
jgi:hypothetical protein